MWGDAVRPGRDREQRRRVHGAPAVSRERPRFTVPCGTPGGVVPRIGPAIAEGRTKLLRGRGVSSMARPRRRPDSPPPGDSRSGSGGVVSGGGAPRHQAADRGAILRRSAEGRLNRPEAARGRACATMVLRHPVRRCPWPSAPENVCVARVRVALRRLPSRDAAPFIPSRLPVVPAVKRMRVPEGTRSPGRKRFLGETHRAPARGERASSRNANGCPSGGNDRDSAPGVASSGPDHHVWGGRVADGGRKGVAAVPLDHTA